MRRIKLCDICDFQGGSQPPKNQWIDSPQYGYIRMLQIRDFTQSEKVKPEYIKITSSSKVCNEDDILIARYGASVGKILTGLAGAYNVAIMKTIPDEEKISKRFLFHFLSSQYFQNYIMNVGSRAAQAGFNKDDLQGISLKEYSLKEQADICSILDEINVIIKKRKKQLKYIENVVKSRFIEMFYEKGYPVLKWEKVFNTTTGKLDSNAAVEEGKYPFFTCSKEELKIDKFAFDQEALLLAGNNAAGKYDVKYYKGKFNAYQRTYVLGLKEEWSYQLFRYQLEDKLIYLQQKSLGGLTKYLTMKILNELDFIIPPMEKQIEFEMICNQTDKSKYYNFTSYKYCVVAANLIRQEWMLCQTLSF